MNKLQRYIAGGQEVCSSKDVEQLENRLAQALAERDHAVAELSGKTGQLESRLAQAEERADRGCHSACLEHEVNSTSHHPDCMKQKYNKLKDEIAHLEAEIKELKRENKLLRRKQRPRRMGPA